VSLAPHNQDARQPADASEWLPTIIITFFYGCAALNTWGCVSVSTSFIKWGEGGVMIAKLILRKSSTRGTLEGAEMPRGSNHNAQGGQDNSRAEHMKRHAK